MINLPEDFTSAKPIKFPCMAAQLVPADQVIANDYNPNGVATPEMELLAQSIQEDGVTQGIVVWYDAELGIYLVVDGYHRYTILKQWFGCVEIPVVVIEANANGRIAATIRHNRARGKHQVDRMADIIEMLRGEGMSDDVIAEKLGMEAEEVLRLRQLNKIL